VCESALATTAYGQWGWLQPLPRARARSRWVKGNAAPAPQPSSLKGLQRLAHERLAERDRADVLARARPRQDTGALCAPVIAGLAGPVLGPRACGHHPAALRRGPPAQWREPPCRDQPKTRRRRDPAVADDLSRPRRHTTRPTDGPKPGLWGRPTDGPKPGLWGRTTPRSHPAAASWGHPPIAGHVTSRRVLSIEAEVSAWMDP
jgi:hypothetical protein